MELGLSLGETSKQPCGFMEKPAHALQLLSNNEPLGFCMALSIAPTAQDQQDGHDADDESENHATTTISAAPDADEDPPFQLDLLPNTPVPRSLPWTSSDNRSPEAGPSGQILSIRGFDVNRAPVVEEPFPNNDDAAAVCSSPNSASASSFQMDFCIYSGGASNKDGDQPERSRASSRGSDEDENGSTRKKLRLSKDQSAFLEESFKEHNTLNPKQKLALAKQLNLRPRQVEVWFQNRRARTKLKQTEVDCEYLKRCCETLTEENRRLQKELQELRALKTSNPFYMQLPATTLTMCPSCERVATTSNPTTTTGNHSTDPTAAKTTALLNRPRFYPFAHTAQANTHQPKPTGSRETVKQIEK